MGNSQSTRKAVLSSTNEVRNRENLDPNQPSSSNINVDIDGTPRLSYVGHRRVRSPLQEINNTNTTGLGNSSINARVQQTQHSKRIRSVRPRRLEFSNNEDPMLREDKTTSDRSCDSLQSPFFSTDLSHHITQRPSQNASPEVLNQMNNPSQQSVKRGKGRRPYRSILPWTSGILNPPISSSLPHTQTPTNLHHVGTQYPARRKRGRPPSNPHVATLPIMGNTPNIHVIPTTPSTLHSVQSSVGEGPRSSTPANDPRIARRRRRMFAYWDCGDAVHTCPHCRAMLWYEERSLKSRFPLNPEFSICCGKGKVKLPLLNQAPQVLRNLMDYHGGQLSQKFRKSIRVLNAMFALTSIGGHIDHSVNDGSGPYVFRLGGQNHHRIGSLFPETGVKPRYAQLYIHDTEHEIQNRYQAMKRIPERSDDIPIELVRGLIRMLNEHNPLVQSFRMAKERFSDQAFRPVGLRLIGTRSRDARQYNMPTASEVAALVPGDGHPTNGRDVIVEERGGNLKRISELHPSFMAMQYPLLFPYGEDGWRVDIPLNVGSESKRNHVTQRQFYAFRLQQRKGEGQTVLAGGRLLQQYAVDAYSSVESNNLDYIKKHQAELRTDLYNGLCDHVSRGETIGDAVGRRFILPSTYTGGPRYMVQNYQDAMAICRWAGPPDLFITMTCNPKWPEIIRHCENIPGQPSEDRPDIVTRMFQIKLDELMKDLRQRHHFGRVQAAIYTIEFQKRGLPHAHILLFLHPEDKITTPTEIDEVISAELPDPNVDPVAYEAVRKHMIHGPCGLLNPKSPCMQNRKCTKEYPKSFHEQTTIGRDGWPHYRRRNNGVSASVSNNDIKVDSRYVVPHNVDLLIKYDCHINVEWCNQGTLIKYLFKYLNKGQDMATVVIGEGVDATPIQGLLRTEDEIQQYLDCRYISASEACWRLFEFETQYRSVGVERLNYHEEGKNPVYFDGTENVDNVVQRTTASMSKFTEWMKANEVYPEGRHLTYGDFPTMFTWHQDSGVREWRPRKNSAITIGRIYNATPSEGERFYLRMLLNYVRGPRSFEEIRTVNGIVHKSYKDACQAMGLLDDDAFWIQTMHDGAQWQTGHQLRKLFVTLLLFSEVSDESNLFKESFPYLSEDIVFNQRRLLHNDEVEFTDEEIMNYTLMEIEKILNGHNRRLSEFPSLPQPQFGMSGATGNMLLNAEKRYNKDEEAVRFTRLFSGLNHQQRQVYNEVMDAVAKREGGVFFVYGNGGTGKTYLWNTIIASMRSRGQIVLPVASSGIASLLLPGGRTAHSMFKIPMKLDDESCCSIDKQSDLARLINATDLIIWDEAPLQHRYAFEAVNRTLQDICSCNKIFGGKVMLLGGDFRQVLPVIPNGRRNEIVNASINRSVDIWGHCQVFVLTINMRLRDTSLDRADIERMREFSKWLLDMGNGQLPAIALDGEDEATWITIPHDLIIPVSEDPIKAAVQSTYPDLQKNLTDPSYLTERAILASTNDSVDEINSYLLDMVPGDKHQLLSSDRICPTSGSLEELQIMYPVEFLNTLRFSGVPNHEIELKVGVPIMLLRNISVRGGLCNGTRLIVTQISTRLLEAVIITGSHVGEKVLIPKIEMTPTDSKWPFQFRRRQFPIKVCFAMTINKSQGQTFKYVCAFLKKPVFTHGQLYVAASRVTSRAGLRIYIDNDERCANNLTTNVVYKEVYHSLPSGDWEQR